MRRTVRQSERGFTLMELMVAAALGLIVIGGVFGTMVTQQQTYMTQLQISESAQNARAALDIVRTSLRAAGWGFVSSEAGTGIPPVGTCWAANVADQSACNELAADMPNGSAIMSDRLRIFYIEPGASFSRNTTWSSSTKVVVNDATRTPLVANDLAIMSGSCTAPTTGIYTGIVKVTAVTSNSSGATYTFNTAVDGYPAFACTNMSAGFAFGLGHVTEFWVDRALATTDKSAGATNTPRLMMMTNRGGRDPFAADANALPVAQTVAYDIDALQVRYGLDCGSVTPGQLCKNATNGAPDNIIDNVTTGNAYCNDLRSTNCDSGLTVLQNQMRVMAVQLAIIPRTRDMVRKTTLGQPMTGGSTVVFGSTIPGDGYRRWIFRSTVALRNNQLPKKGS